MWLLPIKLPSSQPSSTFTSAERRCEGGLSFFFFPNVGDIRVTFSPHCGIVGVGVEGGGGNIGALPGRDEEEQAESADRLSGDPRWECTTVGSPTLQLGSAQGCCWGCGCMSWGPGWGCDGGWGWWTSAWGMIGGLEGEIDRAMLCSGPPDAPGGSLFT